MNRLRKEVGFLLVVISLIMTYMWFAGATRTGKDNQNFTSYDAFDLFAMGHSTVVADSVKNTGTRIQGHRDVYFVSDTTSPGDTITSNVYETTSGEIKTTICIDSVSHNFGTMSVKIQYGMFRGPGYGTDGFEWQDLITVTSDTDYVHSIKNETWNSDKPYQHFAYRILENGQQSNQYRFLHEMWGKK